MSPKKDPERDTAPLLPKEDDAPGSTYNLCCCPKRNFIRSACMRLASSTTFDSFILLVILGNCVMMASSSPLVEEPEIYHTLEVVCNVIFTFEMVLKIIALGLSTYLDDGWNLLDVLVVSTAWAPYIFPGMGNYSAIRAVRVLRALRTVNRIPSLKRIIGTLLSAIPELYNVSILFCFFLFLFGIIGVTLFSGKLHNRCTDAGAPPELTDDNDGAICAVDSDCDDGQTCVFYEMNPSNGAVSYDNCLWAFITIFQAVTLEGWVDQMYMLERVEAPLFTGTLQPQPHMQHRSTHPPCTAAAAAHALQ